MKRNMNRLPDHELANALRPTKRRIIIKHMFRIAALGMTSAFGAAILICTASFFIPIESLWTINVITALSFIFASLIAGWFTRPSVYNAAKTIDKLGLQEKVMTACELSFSGRNDDFAKLQRQDAINSLKTFNKRQIKINLDKRSYIILSSLAVFLVTVNLLPNTMDDIIRQRKQLQAEIKEQLEELQETVEEELANDDVMTEEQRQEFAKLAKELSEKLKNVGDLKESLKDISETEDKLAALTEQIQAESIGRLAEQLSQFDATKSLAGALDSLDQGKIQEAIEQLKEQLTDAGTGEELAEQLKDALQKAADGLSAGDLKDKLASIAEQIQNGQSADAAMNSLGELLKNAAGSSNVSGEMKYALQQMRNKIANAAGQSGTKLADNSGNPSTSNGSNTGNNDQSGNNQGNSQNGQNSGQSGQSQGSQGDGQNGQGQNDQGSGQNGQGQGQGQGGNTGNSGSSGQSGSGVGTGSSNNDYGRNEGGTTSSQDSQTQGKDAKSTYEQIYAPERLGDGGEVSYVPGQQTGSGETETEEGKGLGELSGYIPYNEVYLEYKSAAMDNMKRRSLPVSIQGLVQDYFSSLDD